MTGMMGCLWSEMLICLLRLDHLSSVLMACFALAVKQLVWQAMLCFTMNLPILNISTDLHPLHGVRLVPVLQSSLRIVRLWLPQDPGSFEYAYVPPLPTYYVRITRW
jgi:hypothetical protein